jgi:hypothetical protein
MALLEVFRFEVCRPAGARNVGHRRFLCSGGRKTSGGCIADLAAWARKDGAASDTFTNPEGCNRQAVSTWRKA